MKNQLFKIKLASIALLILLSKNINSQSPCQLILSKTPTTTICAGSQVTLGVSVGSQNSGNGSDGSLTIVNSSTINTDAVKSSVNGIIGIAGSNSIALTSASGFSVGNEVLIITMQDATAGVNNLVGRYELITISAISSNTLIFSQNLLNTYTASATLKHQVIKVPQYTSVTVNNGGVLTCDAWNGAVGGVLCFKANGAVTINSGGSISANGKGYRAVAQKVALWRNADGGQGEGIYGTGIGSSANGGSSGNNSGAWLSANGNGGGGGTGTQDAGGGGGGGYGVSGSAGTNGGHSPGLGGLSVGNSSVTILIMGGAGGEGGADEDGGYPGTGGNGGGIVAIYTNTLNVTGNLTSNGNIGNPNGGGTGGGMASGGGGAGGSINLIMNSFSGTAANITSLGGIAVVGPNGIIGGNGGNGRIRIDAPSPLPVTNPAAYQGTNTIASGVAYSWSNGSVISTSNSCLVSPSITTNYTITVTTTLGCSSASSVIAVNVNPNPTITVNSGSICSGQIFTINPSGANTYTIQGGNLVVSPTSNTFYTVIGTNTVTGCVSQAVVTSSLIVNPNPTITVNSGVICAGQNFTINPAGASTYSYSSVLAVVNPSANITYTVTGTSVAGCTNTAVSSVTVNPNPVITVNNGTICAGQNFTIIAAGASSYSYSSGSSVVAPTSNANYTVTGTNIAGCSNSAVSIIIVNASPIITVNSGAICVGQSFTINPNGANTYTIQGGNSVVSPSVNSTYTVVGTNTITGCRSQSFATSNLTVNPNPTVSISGSSVVCLGESISLVANGANTYVWNNNATTTTIVITPTTSSTYSVVGTDANGCVGLSASLGVIVNTVPIISIASTATTICVGEGVILTANGANTYTWSGGLNTSSISVSPSVSTTYSASGSGTNSCVGSNTLQVIVSECTSINTIASKTEFKVYPNPNNGEFTIELTNINNSNITITNVLGQIIKSQKAELMNQINLNLFDKGIYFINVMENNQSVYRGSMIKE